MVTQSQRAVGLYHSELEHDACGVGFLANISGKKSHEIIQEGLKILYNLKHRGATGADNKTGDGAGITIQVPHKYFETIYPQLPLKGSYATGIIFFCKEYLIELQKLFLKTLEAESLDFLFWREVPVNMDVIGETAKLIEPYILQIFIKKPAGMDQREFECKLFIVRKIFERAVSQNTEWCDKNVHVCSLSANVLVYKGLILPDNLADFYLDLKSPDVRSAIAVVHSRFSTNTFPRWDLAQPLRYIAHNGEINTIKGNRLWTTAREYLLKTPFIKDIQKIFPLIEPDKSDSASLDNVIELLHIAGYPLPEAVMMLLPESCNKENNIPSSLRSYFEYLAMYLELWEGPATIAYTDGKIVGAMVDRNGLRPARYCVTKDGTIVFASEAGVLDFDPERIQMKGRLKPGKVMVVDTIEEKLISDQEFKLQVSLNNPYENWLKKNLIYLKDFELAPVVGESIPKEKIDQYHQVFAYNIEDINTYLKPMCETGKEPIGAMGNDVPLPVLSKKYHNFFNP